MKPLQYASCSPLWQSNTPEFRYTRAMNEAVTSLLRQAEAFDGFPAISDQAQREAQTGARRLFTRTEPGGSEQEDTLTAVGIVGAGEVDLLVRPGHRGAGLGGELFTQLLREAEPGPIRLWVHGDNPAATHLAQRHGFTPVRLLLRLELDPVRLAEAPAPTLPEGVGLVSYTPGDEWLTEELIRVNAAAFASHPEQGEMTRNDFLHTTQEEWFRPDDLFFAVHETDTEPEVLAFSWIKTITAVGGGTETELYVIGVHPDAAGRGLGTVMLQETFRRMHAHSPTRVTLYVEGDNEPALALYRRAGFTVAQRSQQWEKAEAL